VKILQDHQSLCEKYKMEWRKRYYCIDMIEGTEDKNQTGTEEKIDKDCNTDNTDENIKVSGQKNESVKE
jgi:hypothetical protein